MEERHISLQTLWDAIQHIKTEMLPQFDEKVDPIQSSLGIIQNSGVCHRCSTAGAEQHLPDG